MVERILEQIRKEEQQERRLRTFANYGRAWQIWINAGMQADGVRSLQDAIMRGSSRPPTGTNQQRMSTIDRHLRRGALCKSLLDKIVRDREMSLEPDVSLWVPVISYYCVHAYGLAALTATTTDPPTDHASFLNAVRDLLARRFPPYVGATFSTGTRLFRGLGITPDEAGSQSNLANPDRSNAERLVGKSLTTTCSDQEESQIERAMVKARRAGRARLPPGESRRIREQRRETGIVDFLWRVRCRCNYGDPDMFDTEASATLLRSLSTSIAGVTVRLAGGLEAVASGPSAAGRAGP